MSYFQHNCSDCVYLGSIETDRKYDLHCHDRRLLVSRCGNSSSDESSLFRGNRNSPEFIEAVRLAEAKGFKIEVPSPPIVDTECKECGKQLVFSCRAIGTGYCHPCAHKELARLLKETANA